MRRVEAGVDVTHQRMVRPPDPVTVDTPEFPAHVGSVDTVVMLYDSVGREAGAEHGRDVVFGPANHFHQRFPERLLVQRWIRHVGARDDQCIEPLFRELVEIEIVFFDMCFRLRSAVQLGQRERVNVKLCDLV